MIWDYSAENWRLLKTMARRHGLSLNEKAHRILQYVPSLEIDNWGNSPEKKTFDVAFVGTMSSRRKRILNQLQQLGYKILVLEPNNANNFGQERNRQLLKARILLNIHYEYDYQVFEEIRCSAAVYNGLSVVSEESLLEDKHPIKQYVRFASYNQLVSTVDSLLNDKLQQKSLNVLRYEVNSAFMPKQRQYRWTVLIVIAILFLTFWLFRHHL
jgi:hypothetical protein